MNIAGTLIVWCGLVLLAVCVISWQALVGVKLWAWFLEPLTGWPTPSIQILMGILLMYRFLLVKPNYKDLKPDTSKELMTFIFGAFLAPLFALCMGYLIKVWF